MSRVTRLLKTLQDETTSKKVRKQNDLPSTESLDVSSIEKASFLQGEEFSSHGNPLHSTALDDESRSETDRWQKARTEKRTGEGRENEAQAVTETPKRPGHAVKNLKIQKGSDVQAQKTTSSIPRRTQKPPEQTGHVPISQHLQAISESRKNAGKKRAQSKGRSSGSSATKTSPDTAHTQSQMSPSLSSEDLTDEDETFHPSNQRRKTSHMSFPGPSSSSQPQRGQKQKRKSSSGSSVTDANSSKKQKPGVVRNPTDLDVVLEAFQEFVTQYKESVSSEAVQKAIHAFSHSFEEQLTEMTTAAKELNSVKREAAKVNRILTQKKTRLLESKNELITSTAEMQKLKKEHSELKQRLTSLRQGTAFLTNLAALNRRYLKHRSTHTDELETYGPICMPAMLLEARSIIGAENQLKNINDKLQQVLKQ